VQQQYQPQLLFTVNGKHSRAAKLAEGRGGGGCNGGSIEGKNRTQWKGTMCWDAPMSLYTAHSDPSRYGDAFILRHQKEVEIPATAFTIQGKKVWRKLYFLNGYLWVCTSTRDHHFLSHFSNHKDCTVSTYLRRNVLPSAKRNTR